MSETTSNETLTSDQPAFWEIRYREQQTPWDLGQPAPPFVRFMQSHRQELSPGIMAVVGCGLGHDAAFFARQGFDVTGIDIVEEAVEKASQLYGDKVRFVQANLFEPHPEWAGQFDYVLEHTCFCAIRPNQREDYVKAVASMLKPGGRFIGLFWAHQEWGGPPYKTDTEEIIRLFGPYFEIDRLAVTPDSVEGRQNEELLALFRRKA